MSLSEYARFAQELERLSGEVAKDYLSIEPLSDQYYNYGLSLGFELDNQGKSPKLDLLNKIIVEHNLTASIPVELQTVPEDTDKVSLGKLNKQFKYVCHLIGRSKLDGTGKYADSNSDEMMSILFAEIAHYLDGPYQVEGGIPQLYEGLGREGIHRYNLEMHKLKMKLFANKKLNGDPVAIRESLGLPNREYFGDLAMFTQVGEVLDNHGSRWNVSKFPNADKYTYYFVHNPTTNGPVDSNSADSNSGVLIRYTKEVDLAKIGFDAFSANRFPPEIKKYT